MRRLIEVLVEAENPKEVLRRAVAAKQGEAESAAAAFEWDAVIICPIQGREESYYVLGDYCIFSLFLVANRALDPIRQELDLIPPGKCEVTREQFPERTPFYGVHDMYWLELEYKLVQQHNIAIKDQVEQFHGP